MKEEGGIHTRELEVKPTSKAIGEVTGHLRETREAARVGLTTERSN